jgi:hypothetical protein
MDFLKKHYEKILLSVVLLGLVAALVFMALMIPSEQQKVRDFSTSFFTARPTPLPDLDLARQSNVVAQVRSPYRLDFETTNRLFNPVEWVRTPDGRVKKATGITPLAAVVTSILPLYTALTLDAVTTNELGARYVIAVERQASANANLRRKQQRFVSVDDPKKDLFTLIQVVGPPEDPEHLVLRLADTGESIQLSKSRPFRRVDGYSADVKYDPDNAKWTGQRIGNHLRFAGNDYTIVDISSNEVVLSAQSNQKKWTLRYTP